MARQFGGMQSSRGRDSSRILLLLGLILFVLFGGAAFLLLQTGEQAPPPAPVVQDQPPPMRLVSVLVPVQEIEAGAALMPHMFRQEKRPQVGVSERAVASYEEIQGTFARSLIFPGQPLHKEYLTTVRPANVLTAKIPEGFRAVTIRTDSLTSVGGFARPGARVDVNWSTKINGEPAIVPIVENAEVLSADSQTTNQPGTTGIVPNTVTLLVTADDAKRIQLAAASGALSLSLRGDSDSLGSQGPGKVTISDLKGKPVEKAPVRNDGTVIVGGKKYYLVDGSLVSADSLNE